MTLDERMMKTTIIVMLACLTALIANVGHALSDEFPDNAQVLPFSGGRIFCSITRFNNTINVGIPLTAIRFILRINDKDIGFAEPLNIVTLKTGDTLELVEKHHTIKAYAEINQDEARLSVTTTFDRRSFGDTVKTEHFVFREENTQQSSSKRLQAIGDISLTVRLTTDGMAELLFENTGNTPAKLDIPVEGSGSCDKYFDIEAELPDGTPARKSMLYAPSIPSFVVMLKPRGRYVHRIKPSAYLNNIEIGKLKRLRITYTNPLEGTTTTANWTETENKPPSASPSQGSHQAGE